MNTPETIVAQTFPRELLQPSADEFARLEAIGNDLLSHDTQVEEEVVYVMRRLVRSAPSQGSTAIDALITTDTCEPADKPTKRRSRRPTDRTPKSVEDVLRDPYVRPLSCDDGDWYFAADVCSVEGLTNTVQTLALHVSEANKRKMNVGLRGSPPWFINKEGIREIIERKWKPRARMQPRLMPSRIEEIASSKASRFPAREAVFDSREQVLAPALFAINNTTSLTQVNFVQNTNA